MSPSSALRRLEARFGRQGWWPVTPAGGTRPAYRAGRYAPPPPRGCFEVCAGAILTQNTAWTNVERALEALNGARAVDPEALGRLPLRRLERLIRSSGYFRQKAGRLRGFARWAGDASALSRKLRRAPLPALREELLAVKGVGPETADSMLLYAGGRTAFVVDAYTRRIGARVGWYRASASYEAVQAFFTARLPRSPRVYNELHALFVRLAKDHCRVTPECAGCPLKPGCRRGGGA